MGAQGNRLLLTDSTRRARRSVGGDGSGIRALVVSFVRNAESAVATTMNGKTGRWVEYVDAICLAATTGRVHS